MTRKYIAIVTMCLGLVHPAVSQQVPDLEFEPSINMPVYAAGKGPVVLVDEAHHNFHTIATRYHVFAKVLQRDGYIVKPNKKSFTKNDLQQASVLVIANAVHPDNETVWSLPALSAFSVDEIKAVRAWVSNGGSLLLIADHMPFPGASHDLAAAFGFKFYNGFATDTTSGLFPGSKKELDIFVKNDKSLANHFITTGRSAGEQIEQVVTFTGQAFEIPEDATSILTFDHRFKILLPDTAWKFNQQTRRILIKGFSQGAVKQYGNGRVAVFGEAAMFTGQLKGKDKIPFGINTPEAKQNLQFLLNLIHWLDKKNYLKQ